MQPDPRLILVDGSSYLFRAYHALPPLSTSAGQPTGAVLGVLNMLNKLMNEHQPTRMAVVFDASGKTFRDDLFADYKLTRPPMPDELRAQLEPLLEAVRALGLPLLRVPGVEADDVIGTLARQANEAGLGTLISTMDKDMAQLVDGQVTLVNTMSDTWLDPEGVKAKFGVTPAQIADYIALIGDTSDNIPGVPKVGPKTASKWLGDYGSLGAIVAHAADIPGKVGDSLRENLERLELSRRLTGIRCDLELDVAAADLRRTPPDYDALRALYAKLELSSLLRQLPEGPVADAPADARPAAPLHYETILTREALDEWIERLSRADLFGFDTETTSLRYREAEIVGVSFAVAPGVAAYVPLAHDYADAPEQLDRQAVLEALRPLLESAVHRKVGHHVKYDAHVLRNHGIRLAGMAYDSMLESYVLNSTASRHDMDSLALRYLGLKTVHYEDIAGRGSRQIPFSQIRIEDAAPYAAEDAVVTLRLHERLWPDIEAVAGLRSVYENIELPLAPVLQRMEYTGVLIDAAMLRAQSRELAEKMRTLEEAAYHEAGAPFNIGSPKQIQEIFFERLDLPVLRKTPKGQPSTAEDVLQELALSFPLPRLILEFRALSKLKSTYTDKLPLEVNAVTGRVHTCYHQAVAATGRLSSSDPNLQNIPIRTPEGRRIRQAFIAPPGRVLLAADYSQIELRIMAHLSGDAGLRAAFAKDSDIHRATAAEVFRVPLEDVQPEHRRSAKAINFGLMYGMSAFGLARQLGIERAAAQAYVDLYFERYPGVKAFMDRTRATAREQGFVETVFGRRLYLPEINSRNAQRRQYAERSAINAPMQGTAADIIKRAMIAVDRWIEDTGVPAQLIMQVHDELVLEVEEAAIDEVTAGIRRIMCDAARLEVPLRVEAGTGLNWDEAH
ncbi:MAG TPA: DNA polymerase I [Gammaproteobacteria bacterium]|nr:DNA polymerase I [Gammaproteobacteria bacterium]